MIKAKLILILFPIFCFSMTFDDNFSLITDYYNNLLSDGSGVKILFSKDYKKDLNRSFSEKEEVLLLFFPNSCGLDLFVNDQSCFESIQSIRDYTESIGFQIIHFQIISEIASFKNLHEMNGFYLKYFNQKVNSELLENRFSNHTQDYFFPIKFCSLKLKKINPD